MKKLFILINLFFLVSTKSFTQRLSISEQIRVDPDNTCTFNGETIEEKVTTFSSSEEAREIVFNIVDVVGLKANFLIKAANVPNASATIIGQQRYILYNKNFISQIGRASGTDWAGITILAHEVGHHLNGHTIQSGGSRPPIELEADEFSGFVSAKLGATLEEAQAAMKTLASPLGSRTHPGRADRLEAIERGWNNGKTIENLNKSNEDFDANSGDYYDYTWDKIVDIRSYSNRIEITQTTTFGKEKVKSRTKYYLEDDGRYWRENGDDEYLSITGPNVLQLFLKNSWHKEFKHYTTYVKQ